MFELREAIRRIGATPTVSIIIVFSLAFAVAVDTGIFKVFHELSWRRLSVYMPGQLVTIGLRGPTEQLNYSYPMYRELRDGNRSLEGLIGYWPTTLSMGTIRGAERIDAEMVTGNYYSVLGIRPFLGRLISPMDEQTPGREWVAVLSYGFWKRNFGGDLNVIGRNMLLNGHSFTIIGVLDPSFRGLEVGASPEVQLPVMTRRITVNKLLADPLVQKNALWLRLVGRRRAEFSLEQVQSEFNLLFSRSETSPRLPWPVQTVANPADRGVSVLGREYAKPMLLLLALVSATFLSACLNLASLMAARSIERRSEYSTRLALGASMFNLIRLIIWEALLMAFSGGVLGVLFSIPVFQLVVAYLPIKNPTDMFSAFPDATELMFAFAASFASTILLSAVPVFQLLRLNGSSTSAAAIHAGSRVLKDSSVIQVYVAAQVAMSVMLLSVGFLLSRSVISLDSADLGYNRHNLVMVSLNPEQAGLDPIQSNLLYANLLGRVRDLPTIVSAGAAYLAPLTKRDNSINFCFEGHPLAEDASSFHFNPVSDGYLSALGISLLAGREFSKVDVEKARKVAMINDRLAKTIFGSQNPIGRHLGMGCEDAAKADFEIIGVARTAKFQSIRESEIPMVYVPFTVESQREMTLLVRTSSDPRLVVPAILGEARQLNSRVPIYDVKTLESHVANTLNRERLLAVLANLFSTLALLMAGLGIFGSVSNLVSIRRREIGIRLALGSSGTMILLLIARHVLRLLFVGTSVGLVFSLAITHAAQSVLYGVRPIDVTSLSLTLTMLFATAFLAVALPAHHALRIDPAVALRAD